MMNLQQLDKVTAQHSTVQQVSSRPYLSLIAINTHAMTTIIQFYGSTDDRLIATYDD